MVMINARAAQSEIVQEKTNCMRDEANEVGRVTE